jgi:hypothetical protein
MIMNAGPPHAVKTTSRIFFWQALYRPVLHCSHFWRNTDNLERMFLRAHRALLYTTFSAYLSKIYLPSLDYLLCPCPRYFWTIYLIILSSLHLFKPHIQLLSIKYRYTCLDLINRPYKIFIPSIYCILQLIHTLNI